MTWHNLRHNLIHLVSEGIFPSYYESFVELDVDDSGLYYWEVVNDDGTLLFCGNEISVECAKNASQNKLWLLTKGN